MTEVEREHRRYCWLCNPALKAEWSAPVRPGQAKSTTAEEDQR